MPLERNLAALRRRSQALAEALEKLVPPADVKVVPSQSGLPTLRLERNGKPVYLHSPYDPREEGRRWAAGVQAGSTDILLVIGVGLGYHVEELAARFPQARILAFDGGTGLLGWALRSRDLTGLVERPNVTLCVETDPLALRQFLYGQVSVFRLNFLKFLAYRPLYDRFGSALVRLHRDLLRAEMVMALDRATMVAFGLQWAVNLLRNLPKITRSAPARCLFEPFRGRPGVIVSAGPSLDKNIHLLKEVKDRAVIIATGTALKAILKLGIEPDVVVSIDPGPANYEFHFKDVAVREAALVFEPRVHHSVVAEYGGPTFVAPAAGSQWLEQVLGEPLGAIWAGPSVANVAFSLAYLMGLTPIIFIGQDLAYGDGQTHAAGTDYQVEVDWENRPGFIEVEGNLGGKVYTSSIWLDFLEWFEQVFSRIEGPVVINATEGGARIRGTEVMTFKEAIQNYVAPLERRPFSTEIAALFAEHQARNAPEWHKRVRDFLAELRGKTASLGRDARRGRETAADLWREACKERYDVSLLHRLAQRLDRLDARVLRVKRGLPGAEALFGQAGPEVSVLCREVQEDPKFRTLAALEVAQLYFARHAEVAGILEEVAREVEAELRGAGGID